MKERQKLIIIKNTCIIVQYKKQIQKRNRIKSKRRVQDTKSYYTHVRTYLTIIPDNNICSNIFKYPFINILV